MSKHILPTVHRMALIDHLKQLKLDLQQEVFNLLGGKCAICGTTEGLRLRFCLRDNPLATEYRNHPTTLYRRIIREPEMKNSVHLLCRPCRLDLYGKGSSTSPGNEIFDGDTAK